MTTLQSRTSLSGIHILCVDDYQDSLTLLTNVLERHGAEVTQCRSGEHALVLLENMVFDLIISDLSMPPGMDGYDLVHILRKMELGGRSPTPTIALSGQARLGSPKKCFADFQVYLSKPFDRAHLVDVARRLAEADGDAVGAGSLELYDTDQRALVAAHVLAEKEASHRPEH